MQPPSQDPNVENEAPRSRKARFLRHCQRTLVGTALLFVLLLSAAGASALYMKGREVTAPPWIKDRLTAELEEALPRANIQLGDFVAVLDEGWLPRFFVRDFEVLTETGEQVLKLADVSAGLDTRALLDRRLSLSSLQANGVFLTLRRDEDGGFMLFSGDESGAVAEAAPSLAMLIGQLDDFFMTPEMITLNEVDVRAITLRYEDLMSGRVWTVDGGRLRVDRDGLALEAAADLALLGGSAGVATISANYTGVIGDTASEFGFQLVNLDARDIASQSSAFGWLTAIEAPISGAFRGGIDDDGGLQPLNAVLQISPGVIQPRAQARPIPIEGALSYFTYLPAEQSLQFDVLEIASQWGSGVLDGAAYMVTNKRGRLEQLIGQLRIEDLSLNPAELYETPVVFDDAALDFRLTLDPFNLQIGRIDIQDDGQFLSANGNVFVDEAGWKIAMDAQMDGIAAARVKELWPEGFKPRTRKWVRENVLEGQLANASAALRLVQGERPNTYISFDFSDANVRFLKRMPPVQRARGHASLIKDRFVAVLDEGAVTAPQGGDLDMSGTSFIVPDTRIKPDPPAVVRLEAAGPVTAALSMLDQPPLEVMQKVALPVDVAQGAIALEGTISTPLARGVPLEAVEFDIVGAATDVRSDALVKNRMLTAERLDVRASDDEVRLSGAITLDDLPATVVWRQPIGVPGTPQPGQVTGRATVTADALERLDIRLPPGVLQGGADATFTLDLVKGAPPVIALQSDLRGLRLAIPEVNWSKRQEVEGALNLTATLDEVPRVDALELDAPGFYAQGDIRFRPDRTLDRLRLDKLRIGDWLNAPVDLSGRGAGQPVGVALRGGRLDLRRAALGGGRNGGGGPLNVRLDSLQVSDTIAITDLRGSFTTTGGLAGNFEGAVNGEAAINGQVTPREGRSALRVQGQDAGRVLAAAGLMQTVRGGRVNLELVPIGTDGAFDGKLSVRNTRVTEAPTMAALLNAVSVVGLIDELNGDGIRFSEIDADFRITPSRITLREASAVGASMGLSMDGVFVPDTGALQMQGVISPVYALNAIGSILTRRGEGLFGFNYSISGTADDPQVFVNPLTALAPGMLRNIFRSELPDVPLEDGEVAQPKRGPPDLSRHQDR